MSPDDLGREPLDEQLRGELRSTAPRVTGDADDALRALTPRFRRARRRRQRVVGAAAVAAVAVVLLGGVALLRGAGDVDRRVRVPPASGTPSSTPSSTAVAEPLPTPSTPEPEAGAEPSSDPSPVASDASSGSPSANVPSDGPSATPAPTAPAAPEEHTYPSDGGALTVRFVSGASSIVSTAPAPGYTEERHDTGPDRVEVRFRNADGEWRIRVDVVDGALSVETELH